MVATTETLGTRVGLGDRPRVRSDLVFAEHSHNGKLRVVVKEPGTGLMMQIGPSAFEFLKLLDGSRTVSEAIDVVTARLGKEAAAARSAMLSLTERLAAVKALEGLAPTEASPVPVTTRTQRALALTRKVNPLRITLPVVDPTPVLRHLDRVAFPLFHPVAYALVPVAVVACVLLLALGNRNPFYSFAAFQTFHDWLWIYPALFVTTVLHETGHAVACRRNGGTVPRMGFMLYLIVFPGCYTDVSDAWLMSKAKRVAVSLAGVHVEAVIWCVAVLVWYQSKPFSTLNQAAFIFGLILVFRITSNLIPFLRLDGYFILSDLLGIPNLRPKAFAFLVGLVPWLGRRYREVTAVTGPRKLILFGYGVASLVTTAAATTYGFRWLWSTLTRFFPPASPFPLAIAITAFVVPLVMGVVGFFMGIEHARRELERAGARR